MKLCRGRAEKELLQGEGAGVGVALPQKGGNQQITLHLQFIDCYPVEMMKTMMMRT